MTWFVRMMFLRGFARALRRQCKWAPTRRELAREMELLTDARHMPGGDKQAAFNLLLAQSLQAAVRLLQGRGYGRARALEMARAAFLENGSGLTQAIFAFWLRMTPDPVAQMKVRRDLADKARKLWGQGMQVEERHAPDAVSLVVTDCPFAQYFWSVSEPDLAPILCAYDARWMAQVNRSKRPVTVTRAGTLAGGAEACDFTFQRRDVAQKPKAKPILPVHPLNQMQRLRRPRRTEA